MAMTFIMLAFIVVALPLVLPRQFKMNLFQIIDPLCLNPFSIWPFSQLTPMNHY